VSLGPGTQPDIGFSAVEFPDFRAPATEASRRDDPGVQTRTTLLLRRGFDGRLAVYDWWNETRAAKRPRPRTITVELSGEEPGRPVVVWTFTGCRPIRLSYSPLDAQTSAVLMETLEVSFEDVSLA
jgi:phage tail-like protein